MTTEPATGVWVVYSWDWNPLVKSFHDDELTARRAAAEYEKVIFVPFGADFNDVESGRVASREEPHG